MFSVGDTVDRYKILARLRGGGMADLFLARREGAAGFRRHVAIKVVHPRHAADEHLVRMFLDEALITARIDHPNVVHVQDLGQHRGTYYLVMEYVHGCSLAQLMKVLGDMKRRLSPTVAVALAARIAEGLHAAHETTDDEGKLLSLVHRDVSPQNILLSHKGHVKLIDFGVAKARLRSEETNVAMLKGKVRYMSPEQATTGIVDRRSDVYSLGIVLWEMLTMRRLFRGKTEFEVLMKVRKPEIPLPSHHVSGIAPELDAAVMTALTRDPERRPQTSALFRRMLAAAEPRSMALDSAHLAELMLSVVGEELHNQVAELPREVSQLLRAEQLRAAIAEAEGLETLEGSSAVEIMTLDSAMANFEIDELDRPSSISSMPPNATKPGSPLAISRSAEFDMHPPYAESGGTLEDADPTAVNDVPEELKALRLLHPPQGSLDSEEMPTLPEAPASRAPGPPVLSMPEPFDPPHATSAPTKPHGALSPRLRWFAMAVAVVVSALTGMCLALLLTLGGEPLEKETGAIEPGALATEPELPPAEMQFDGGVP